MAAVPWEIFGQTLLIPSLQPTPCMGNQICLSSPPDLHLPVTSEQALKQPKSFTLKEKRRKSIQSKDWANRLIDKWATVPKKRRQTELLTGRARNVMAELFPGQCLPMILGEHLPCKACLCSVR